MIVNDSTKEGKKTKRKKGTVYEISYFPKTVIRKSLGEPPQIALLPGNCFAGVTRFFARILRINACDIVEGLELVRSQVRVTKGSLRRWGELLAVTKLV